VRLRINNQDQENTMTLATKQREKHALKSQQISILTCVCAMLRFCDKGCMPAYEFEETRHCRKKKKKSFKFLKHKPRAEVKAKLVYDKVY
jgi:hypothetical protein